MINTPVIALAILPSFVASAHPAPGAHSGAFLSPPQAIGIARDSSAPPTRSTCRQCFGQYEELLQAYVIVWGDICEEQTSGPGCTESECDGPTEFCMIEFMSSNICAESWCWLEQPPPDFADVTASVTRNDAAALAKALERDPRISLNSARGSLQVTSPCAGVIFNLPLHGALAVHISTSASLRTRGMPLHPTSDT